MIQGSSTVVVGAAPDVVLLGVQISNTPVVVVSSGGEDVAGVVGEVDPRADFFFA